MSGSDTASCYVSQYPGNGHGATRQATAERSGTAGPELVANPQAGRGEKGELSCEMAGTLGLNFRRPPSRHW